MADLLRQSLRLSLAFLGRVKPSSSSCFPLISRRGPHLTLPKRAYIEGIVEALIEATLHCASQGLSLLSFLEEVFVD